jgi:hypothetical protein
MSDGPRLPRKLALAAAERLVRELGFHLDPDGGLICGSLRRDRQQVGDIDLVAALPAPGGADRLCKAITERFVWRAKPGMLFTSDLGHAMGWITEGAHAWFKACRLVLVDPAAGEINVEIHRYTPGPSGNRGWIELMRTGPVEFTRWLIVKHKMRQGISRDGDASRDAFLVDGAGKAIPTPTEREVFRVMNLDYIAPERRDEFCRIHDIRRTA